MHELDIYKNKIEWARTLWDEYDPKTREEHPGANPYFVHFDSHRIKMLRPEKCNIEFLYDKYLLFKGMLRNANKETNEIIDEIMSTSDISVVRLRPTKTLVHVIRRSEEFKYSIEYQHAPIFESDEFYKKDSIYRKYTEMRHRSDRLEMVASDLMRKICDCFKYKVESGDVAGYSDVMYEDAGGRKLMFIVESIRHSHIRVYCKSVSFVGEFSEYMNVDKLIELKKSKTNKEVDHV